jgi:hypothetical protein
VIFSKYPFSKKNEQEYRDCSDPDCHTAKGIVATTLRLGKDEAGGVVTLDLAATHMQSKTVLGNYTKTQWNQIDEQRTFLARQDVWGKTADAPLKMLLGDFNFSSTGPQYLADGLLSTQGAVTDAKKNWRKLADTVLVPHGLKAGRLLCGDVKDAEQAGACGEKNPIKYDDDAGEIIKQRFTTSGLTANEKGASRTFLAPVRMQQTVQDFIKRVRDYNYRGGGLGGLPSKAPYKIGDRVDNGRVKAVFPPFNGYGFPPEWTIVIEPDLNADQARQIESDHATQQITYRVFNRWERTAATVRRDPNKPPPPPHEEG